MSFVAPDDPGQGLVFEGRLAEDFKLSSGTWVSVGPLRQRILVQGEGFVADVLIGAPDRPYVTALIFPNLTLCRTLSSLGDAPAREVLAHPAVRDRFASI